MRIVGACFKSSERKFCIRNYNTKLLIKKIYEINNSKIKQTITIFYQIYKDCIEICYCLLISLGIDEFVKIIVFLLGTTKKATIQL